jgi:hypothetical protein
MTLVDCLKNKLTEKIHKLNCTNPVAPIINYITQTKNLPLQSVKIELGWWSEGKCNM